MRKKKTNLVSFFLIGLMLASIFTGAVSGACVIPTDNLYINSDTTLCLGFYDIPDADATGVIIINASNVVLDCNGSTINGTGSGYGIYNPGFDNVTIKNCTVMNYGYGIYLNSSDNNTINTNIVCQNVISDFFVNETSTGNYGDNNTCNTTSGWNDTGTTGCTYTCWGSSPTVPTVPAVPILTPIGLIALVGVLSIILALSIRWKRR